MPTAGQAGAVTDLVEPLQSKEEASGVGLWRFVESLLCVLRKQARAAMAEKWRPVRGPENFQGAPKLEAATRQL